MFNARRQMQSACGRLEYRFCYVMLVPSIQTFDMQIEPAFLDECFQKFFHKFSL